MNFVPGDKIPPLPATIHQPPVRLSEAFIEDSMVSAQREQVALLRQIRNGISLIAVMLVLLALVTFLGSLVAAG